MRRRRVQRCVVRANIALEAGLLDEARAAVEEALSLEPHDETAKDIAGRIAAAAAPPVPAPPVALLDLPLILDKPGASDKPVASGPPAGHERRGRTWRAYAAAAFLTMLAGAAGWYWASIPRSQLLDTVTPAATGSGTRASERAPLASSIASPPDVEPVATPEGGASDAPAAPSNDRVTLASEVSTVAATTGEALQPSGSTARLDSDAVRAAEQVTPPAPESTAPPIRPEALPLRSPDAESSSGGVGARPMPAVSEIALSPAPVMPDPPADLPPVPAPPAAEPSAVTALAASSSISTSSLPAPVVSAADAADVGRERAIRATLGRYESAYSQLDAAAAGAVWPAVDRRALARAFDGLAAQTIRLVRCDIRVSGSTAQADCSGSAQWTPKVGGGMQSAARRWRFELRQAGNDWQIVSANTR